MTFNISSNGKPHRLVGIRLRTLTVSSLYFLIEKAWRFAWVLLDRLLPQPYERLVLIATPLFEIPLQHGWLWI